MNIFVSKLATKIKVIKEKYEASGIDSGSTVLDDAADIDEDLYNSMQRWHVNSHMSDDDWSSLFDEIKDRLDVKEKFNVEKFPEVNRFLKHKFDSNNLRERFSISDIFAEEFELKVKRFYMDKIAERDEKDEFGELSLFEAFKPRDLLFYNKTFLPFAVFFTYSQKHESTVSTKCLMEDIFNIGSGTKRLDLFPEVNAYCHECCPEYESQFHRINLNIFKNQVQNNFRLPWPTEISESESEGENENPGQRANVYLSNNAFNPFLSDSDESSGKSSEDNSSKILVEVAASKIKPFRCKICPKSFSRKDFLLKHELIFHKPKNKVVPKFVCEPVDLITSFCREDQPKPTETSTNTSEVPSKNKMIKRPGQSSDKFKIRKSLRFDKS